MQRTLFFKFFIILIIFIVKVNGQTCPCGVNGNILQCSVTSTLSSVDTGACGSSNYNSITIIYTGNVVLTLSSSSTKSIVIQPLDGSDSHTLQISNIDTQATRIDINIRLSSNQEQLPLFTTAYNVVPSTSTLNINVIQSIPNTNNFTIFSTTIAPSISVANYSVNFDNGSNSGTLNFHNLIHGLQSVSSMSILGNSHYLSVDSSQMPLSITINQLSLKNLRLYDQLLYNVNSLAVYDIEQCQYNRTAKFLNSDRNYTLSIIMKNNNPLDLVLPNDVTAFAQLGAVTSITLIEPNLNSSCLRPIKNTLTNLNLFLQLGSYFYSDFNTWQANRPLTQILTINNIQNLNIFPSRFFSTLDYILQVTLQGTFGLNKTDICAFVGINLRPNRRSPVVALTSTKMNTNDWDNCTDTYIKAINQRTTDNIYCPPTDSCDDCDRWANQTAQCDLVTYENACPGIILSTGNNFRYNNSYLYLFFQQNAWLNQTIYPTRAPITKQDPVNIGAIVGAVCGLVIAMIILGTTVYCIYRYRHKNISNPNISAPQAKYAPSSYDAAHLSIATSKTSQSSRYELQKSFFPIQPNDEIAPPLYTAPSESVGSLSAYNKLPSAPPGPRDSISTHATHVYETLDS